MIQNPKHGVLCLTYDDSQFDNWIAAMPLFEKYGARATFFCNWTVTDETEPKLKKLASAGHTIGLHALTHADAPPYFAEKGGQAYYENEIKPQLDSFAAHGFNVSCFAYPNAVGTEETNEFLLKYFRRLRLGKGRMPEGMTPAQCEPCFVPVSEIASCRVTSGLLVGEYYHTKLEELGAAIRRAAEKNEFLVIISHGIFPGAPHIHMPTETLEFILKLGSSLNMEMCGFDELP